MTFNQMNIIQPILRAVTEEGYLRPTPIQEQAIPAILEGRDLVGCAQTGTGKTAAFAIPVLQRLAQKSFPGKRKVRALVLTPTRELAGQIGESFSTYGRYTGLKNIMIYGGVSQRPQTDLLRRGMDIMVATPGRLLDLVNQGWVDLKHIEIFVLDEADRMLDMGFIHDIRRIVEYLPVSRQSLFFSATIPPGIMKLAAGIVKDAVRVDIPPVKATSDLISQSLYFVDKPDKKSLLIHLLINGQIENALVFTRTKHAADKIARALNQAGVMAGTIHGNKSQQARQKALMQLKRKQIRVLVATDIAARGIDVEELSHVINYEIPNVPEMYLHRIGRTGRAGMAGVAISFCDGEEKNFVRSIQKLINTSIPVIHEHPFTLRKKQRVAAG
ncbi:MAG: DEAD/DEAH box helicase [Bacteroidales bacterium]